MPGFPTLVAASMVCAVAAAGCTGGTAEDDGEDLSEIPIEADGLPVFTEVAAESGFGETQADLAFDGEQTQGAAAAVADVDDDGDLDVFLPRVGKPNGLYLNDGEGNFTDVASEAGVAGPSDRFGSRASAFLDIDGDGDLDLFAAGAGAGADNLWVNDGEGRFTDEAAQRGLDRPVEPGVAETQQHGVAVADVNRDGAMDLLVAQWRADVYNGEAFEAAQQAMGWAQDYIPSPCETSEGIAAAGFPVPDDAPPGRSALYINDGSGNFTDRGEQMGLGLDHIVAFTPVFADLDGDGWQDLAITGDGCTSRLYRNDEGVRFADITDEAGVGTDENGMGSVVRDVNDDGLPDWFVTSIHREVPEGETCPGSTFSACSGNRMYIQEPGARPAIAFADETDAFGVRRSGWGWGAAIEDFSNSGTLDLVATNGFRTADDPDAADDFVAPFFDDTTVFMVRDGTAGDAPFEDVSEAVGIADDGQGHALVAFDMDSDGDLDILIARANDTPLLYRNETNRSGGDPTANGGGSWLTISLEDPTTPGNPWGDGARIETYTDDDATPLVDWIGTSGSYETQRPAVAHRGFGDRTEPIARIEVHWPGADEPQTLTGVELDQQLVITRD